MGRKVNCGRPSVRSDHPATVDFLMFRQPTDGIDDVLIVRVLQRHLLLRARLGVVRGFVDLLFEVADVIAGGLTVAMPLEGEHQIPTVDIGLHQVGRPAAARILFAAVVVDDRREWTGACRPGEACRGKMRPCSNA
jgi:hypothetical protein